MNTKSSPNPANFEFYALQEAKNYQSALIRKFAPFLSGKVLEVGSGIGQMTGHISGIPAITDLRCLEPDHDFVVEFKKSFPAIPLIEGTVKDVPNEGWNAIVNINVLEHIKADREEIRQYYKLLKNRRGTLLLFVPARKELYAPIDKQFGHYRRYVKSELVEMIKSEGFRVREARYYDIIGYFAWWLNFRVMRSLSFDPRSVRFFDRMIFPWSSAIESKLPGLPFGKNILVIAQVD